MYVVKTYFVLVVNFSEFSYFMLSFGGQKHVFSSHKQFNANLQYSGCAGKHEF